MRSIYYIIAILVLLALSIYSAFAFEIIDPNKNLIVDRTIDNNIINPDLIDYSNTISNPDIEYNSNSAERVNCIDSDGTDIFASGRTTKGDLVENDFCEGNAVIEFACLDNVIQKKSIDCRFGCSNGHCFANSQDKTTDEDRCIDEDGTDVFRKGITSKGNHFETDFCEGNNVIEFACVDNEIRKRSILCKLGCLDGSCRNENSITGNIATDSPEPQIGEEKPIPVLYKPQIDPEIKREFVKIIESNNDRSEKRIMMKELIFKEDQPRPEENDVLFKKDQNRLMIMFKETIKPEIVKRLHEENGNIIELISEIDTKNVEMSNDMMDQKAISDRIAPVKSMKLLAQQKEITLKSIKNNELKVRTKLDIGLKDFKETSGLDIVVDNQLNENLENKFIDLAKKNKMRIMDRAGVINVEKYDLKNKEDVGNVTIEFQIEEVWLNGDDPKNARIFRENDDFVEILPTKYLGSEDGYLIFEGLSENGLSTFAMFMVETIESGEIPEDDIKDIGDINVSNATPLLMTGLVTIAVIGIFGMIIVQKRK